MKIWFICKAKHQKEVEDGFVKNVTETYLVDAVSYTEAESRIYQILENNIGGEFIITQITKSNITDVFHFEDSDIWHKCKIVYHVTDDEKGKEKKIVNYALVSANNIHEAYNKIQKSLENMLVSFRVTAITESPIIEIFSHNNEEEIDRKIPSNLSSLSDIN